MAFNILLVDDSVTVRAVETSRAELAKDKKWLGDARGRLAAANSRLRERSERL